MKQFLTAGILSILMCRQVVADLAPYEHSVIEQLADSVSSFKLVISGIALALAMGGFGYLLARKMRTSPDDSQVDPDSSQKSGED